MYRQIISLASAAAIFFSAQVSFAESQPYSELLGDINIADVQAEIGKIREDISNSSAVLKAELYGKQALLLSIQEAQRINDNVSVKDGAVSAAAIVLTLSIWKALELVGATTVKVKNVLVENDRMREFFQNRDEARKNVKRAKASLKEARLNYRVTTQAVADFRNGSINGLTLDQVRAQQTLANQELTRARKAVESAVSNYENSLKVRPSMLARAMNRARGVARLSVGLLGVTAGVSVVSGVVVVTFPDAIPESFIEQLERDVAEVEALLDAVEVGEVESSD